MARYAVRIHSRSGISTAEIQARDARDAEVVAGRRGTVVSVKRLRSGRVSGLTYADRQVLLSRLAAMLGSRVGATDALTLLQDTFKGRIKHVSHELLLKVEAGMSVPEAIAAQGTRDFPSTVSAMIQAGANSGATPQALRDAIAFERHLREIKKGSSKGIWAALGAFFAGLLFTVGTVFFMVPKIMTSPLIQVTGGAGEFEGSVHLAYIVGYVMLGLLILMVLLFLLGTVGRVIAPRLADAIILRIPFYKSIVLSKEHFVAFYGMGLLVKTGVRMENAFALMVDTTRAGALREDFRRAHAAVKQGKPWANALHTLQATDRAALGSSMDREQVSEAMESISLTYRDLYAQRVALLAPILQVLAALGLIISGLMMFGLTVLPVLQVATKMLSH